MSPEELDEWSERYAAGKMEPEEKLKFETELKNHPEWKEIIRLHQALYRTEHLRKSGFRKKLEDIRAGQKPSGPTGTLFKPRWSFWISVAAGSALLLSVVLFFYSRRAPGSPGQWYKEYMKAPVSLSPDLSPSRSATADSVLLKRGELVLVKADEEYMKGRLPEAIRILESSAEYPVDERIRFQTALVYLISDQPQKAISIFAGLKSYNSSEVNWYTAMAHLKLREIDRSKARLRLIEPDSRWYDKSRELQEKL